MLNWFFIIRIAIFSLVGYSAAIAGPLFIDPRLRSHVAFKDRHYPHGWLWWFATPVVFGVPILLLSWWTSNVAIYVASIAPLVLVSAVAAFSFGPERPHMGIVVCATGFALVILVTVACRLSAGDFAFIQDMTVPFESRLERVKAAVAFWQMISVYASAGYLAFAVSWSYAMWFTTEKMVSSPEDRFTLGQAEVGILIAVTACVVLGPLLEAFSNAFAAMAQLSNVMK